MQQSNRTRLPAPAPPHLPPRELQRDVGLRDVGVPVGHLAAVAHRARLGVVGRHELHLMGGGKGEDEEEGRAGGGGGGRDEDTGERTCTRCRRGEGAVATGGRRGPPPPTPNLDVDGAARPELGGDGAELDRRQAGVAARPRGERPGEKWLPRGGEGRPVVGAAAASVCTRIRRPSLTCRSSRDSESGRSAPEYHGMERHARMRRRGGTAAPPPDAPVSLGDTRKRMRQFISRSRPPRPVPRLPGCVGVV